MRLLKLTILATLTLAGCGGTTPTQPVVAFALDAGNYTLKLSGSGFCTGVSEGSAQVTVTRSGAAWSVRSVQTTDTFAMSLTTDGTPAGAARGEVAGTLSSGSNSTMTATGSISGTNPSANVAGGPIATPTGTLGVVVSFSQPSGSGSCTSGTWTLTPR